MHHRFVETHAEGQQHAKGNRHVHIGASVPHGLPGGPEEYPAGICQRGQRDDCRQPMKQIAGLGSAPAQTDTESSMMLLAAKPATASARTSSDRAPSLLSGSKSNRCAWKPACSSVSISGGGAPSARHRTVTRLVERLTRALSTPASPPSAFSIVRMHAPQWIAGTDRSVWRTPSATMRLASSTSSPAARAFRRQRYQSRFRAATTHRKQLQVPRVKLEAASSGMRASFRVRARENHDHSQQPGGNADYDQRQHDCRPGQHDGQIVPDQGHAGAHGGQCIDALCEQHRDRKRR